MFSRRTDLQLDRDQLGGFLPWLIAFMVFLSVLALAGTLALNQLAGRWDTGMSGTLTVQIKPSAKAIAGGAGAKAARAQDEKRLRSAVVALKTTSGVASAEALSEQNLLTLLEPWLGGGAVAGDLPLPRLIDVQLERGAEIDMAALQNKLTAVAPGAVIDDHGVWLARLIRLVRTVEALALAVLAFIALATVGTVIFTTRTGLAIHQDAIEVLHLIGAHDSYIARQFAGRALALGLKGGIIGLLLALPTLWGIGALADSLQSGLLPDLSLGVTHWMTLLVLPLTVAVIAMVTARMTVMKTLARML
ncbi:MAG: FtsX-like permease family protein [Rhodospirillaceae bacterium]|jgi:cell division transport system permease protein|nr:FtsX-like permease family protein [Rhodospirillaceae bacterium]MBT4463524.1 FtsX-like permease family protein [Rhodospirillaceae bacterium]MBT5013628.1 FtsX-like permease family protein [Rhodospirillaceae bacterium]MBT5308789.1 FtsX-like permease family protein [Rhodospirillaceae bacterium]MBT6406045.1 FtsX-like permease family protein [Rhodospirillaceae bacterium]